VEANINQDISRITAVKDMLGELRNSWNTVASQNIGDIQKREAVGLNIAG
jgi:flagellin-specific chaperone FliS